MATRIANYKPGVHQQESVAMGDTLIIPVHGLPLDLVVVPSSETTDFTLQRIPSLKPDDYAGSPRITVTPGGSEDPNGYLEALQIASSVKDLPLGGGQAAWAITPGGDNVTVSWTLHRTKVEDPTIQP